MKQQDGVALIAALLTMTVIVTLGVGALFLTNMNLRIAENGRSHAIARYNAEAGLEAALVRLKQDYHTSKTFPNTLNLPTSPDSEVVYQVSPNQGYVRGAAGDMAEVRILGTVRNNGSARYVSEALVIIGGKTSRLFGIESEGIVNISTGTSVYTDAGVHGNAGVNLGNSDFYTCLARNSSGVCTNTRELHAADIPVSTSNNSPCTVKGERSAACERDHAPITVNPDYLAKRDKVIQGANVRNAIPSRTGTFSLLNNIYCDKVLNILNASTLAASDLVAGRVICIEGSGVTLPSTSLSGVTVIADGDISFDKNADVSLASKTTLISKLGTISLGKKSSVMDSHIFSQGSVDYNGPNNTFGGISTIASAGNISVGGSSSIATDASNNQGIGIAMIAGGDIVVNGSSNWYAGIVAGGSVSANGGPTLYGGIQAKGSITIKGGIDIDSGMSILNDNLAEMSPTITSRR